jgi:hypothetical protein
MAVSRMAQLWQEKAGNKEAERRGREDRERRGREVRETGEERRGDERGGLTYSTVNAPARNPSIGQTGHGASRIFLPTAMVFCGEATFCGAGDKEQPPGNLGCALYWLLAVTALAH